MHNHAENDIEIKGSCNDLCKCVLSDDASRFLAKLHKEFNAQRLELLRKRERRQKLINQGEIPDFLPETAHIRQDPSWSVADTPEPLKKRLVEITGPTDRKMVINAMNSGADVFMADFEDANSPTWDNMIQGQVNLHDTVNGTITFESPDGKKYELSQEHAVLFVRPRGWHLNEKHFLVDGEEISGSLFDFGLYLFHNAKTLIEKGLGPYFYLPKLESHLEARLWNDVFVFAQKELGLPIGTIRATVLTETILAVFEMEEILYELKEHSAGLNAGRWDYIFSIIKKFRRQDLHLPDRDQITMTVPFMRAYTELLVKSCHKRKAHAMGGMAAFIPNKKDPEVTEHALQKVREDKLREVGDGFDGTWVAHPDLVPVAKEVFESALKGKKNQKERLRDDVKVSANDLLNFNIPGGTITEDGIRHNIDVAIQYLASWLSGRGAAAIYNLMEDAATAEISRAQIWQWLQNGSIEKEFLQKLIQQEYEKITNTYGENEYLIRAKALFESLVFADTFVEFLTLPAYQQLK